MRKILSVISLALLIGCAEAPVEVANYSIEQFTDNISVFGGSFSADESKLLVSNNETGIYNVFSLNVDGSRKEQLTFSEKESFYAVSWFPRDDRFLYTADQGGNEVIHVYLQDTEGNVKDLTPWEGSVSRFNGWTRDEKAFYFSSNKRDPRYFDLYRMKIEDFSSELIYENTENLSFGAISSSGKYIALTKSITRENNEMYLLNLESDEIKHISEHTGDATFAPAGFSLDEKYLYYLTDNGREFRFIVVLHLETGEKNIAFETDWDVQYTYFSYNEKYQVIGINQDAKTLVKLLEMTGGNEVKMPSFGDLDITGVSIPKSEKSIRLAAGSSTSPGDLYMYEFGKDDYTRLTNSLNKEIKESDLVSAEVIRYPSFDGLEIPAILYKPRQANKKNKVPALLWIHGGPGGQSRTGFSSFIQFLVNHEYVVLAVNNRGSSGYGKTFYSLDNQRHGEDDLMDCVKAKDFLAGLDYVDMDKIGIMGGSYGGYMTMAALTFHPDEFEVGVNIFGVTNWLRTLKSIPPYWEANREALYSELGDPYTEDSIRLHKISPLFHAKNVIKPLMVLQGANDVRVLQVESDEIVAAVKANGVPVEYIVFDDEGHGFRKKENQIKGYGQVLVFLDKYLKGTEEE